MKGQQAAANFKAARISSMVRSYSRCTSLEAHAAGKAAYND